MAEVPLSVTREFMRESWDTRRANQRRSRTLSARGLEALELKIVRKIHNKIHNNGGPAFLLLFIFLRSDPNGIN